MQNKYIELNIILIHVNKMSSVYYYKIYINLGWVVAIA